MQSENERLGVVRWLLAGQLLGTCIAGLVGLAFSRHAAFGAMLGGLIVVLPHSYFAFRAFRYKGARAAKQVVSSFYAGAFGKMLLSMSMFTLVFGVIRPLNAAAVFAGFTGVLMLNWLVPLIYNLRLSSTGDNRTIQSGISEHGK